LIREGRKLNPQQARDPTRQDVRGRIKQSEAYNLLGRLERHATQVWRFVSDHRVPFDNNQAERDMATLRKQRRPLMAALALSFAGHVPSPLAAD
jgi:transposase